MPQRTLPRSYDPCPLVRMTVAVSYRWETNGYDVRVGRLFEGDPDWHTDLYEDLTPQEVADVLAAGMLA